VPLGILAYLWIRYLKYLDATNAATREQPHTETLPTAMATLRIHGYRDSGVLALDLRDLIGLLRPRSLEANWTVSVVSREYPVQGRSLDEFMVMGGLGINWKVWAMVAQRSVACS